MFNKLTENLFGCWTLWWLKFFIRQSKSNLLEFRLASLMTNWRSYPYSLYRWGKDDGFSIYLPKYRIDMFTLLILKYIWYVWGCFLLLVSLPIVSNKNETCMDDQYRYVEPSWSSNDKYGGRQVPRKSAGTKLECENHFNQAWKVMILTIFLYYTFISLYFTLSTGMVIMPHLQWWMVVCDVYVPCTISVIQPHCPQWEQTSKQGYRWCKALIKVRTTLKLGHGCTWEGLFICIWKSLSVLVYRYFLMF